MSRGYSRNKKPESLKQKRRFRWQQIREDFLTLGQDDILTFYPREYNCTPYAMRDMVKSAVDREQYMDENFPAATTHIDSDGNVLLMLSITEDVVRRPGGRYVVPKQSPYAPPGDGMRAKARSRFNYR